MNAFELLTEGSPGLLTDARVVTAALSRDGLTARLRRARHRNLDLRAPGLLLRAAQLAGLAPRAAANIHFERIWPDWLPLAGRNLFLPNQEWCLPPEIARLGDMDAVLCKTRYAEDIFRRRGLRVEYVGFSSDDLFDSAVAKDYGQYLHVAGRSLQKGTDAVVSAWLAHPRWPTLTIVTSRPELAAAARAPNIRVVGRELTSADLRVLQNRCGVHLCPSQAEGFGHYICEALGCGAIVVTTDAPPMNEVVTPERGLLAAYATTRPQALGTNFYVNPAALEAAVEATLRLDAAARARLSASARAWYLANREAFERRLPRVLRTLCA